MEEEIKRLQKILTKVANITNHGGLLGYATEFGALREIRELTIEFWDKDECDRLQRESIRP